MSTRDHFSVYLHDLAVREVGYRVSGDSVHILDITDDIQLYVRPEDDDLPATITALRKLAATSAEMADALEQLASKPPVALDGDLADDFTQNRHAELDPNRDEAGDR